LLRAAGHERIDFGWYLTRLPDRSVREFEVRVDDGTRAYRAKREIHGDGDAAFEAAEEALVQDVLVQVTLSARPQAASTTNLDGPPTAKRPTARLILAMAAGTQAIALGPRNTIGRHPRNTIALLDKIVAKEHCTIRLRD